MGEQLLFIFEPPLSKDNVAFIHDHLLQRIPVHELEKRAYFESALESLVIYAIDTKHESKNFSLSIGFFDQNFSLESVDEGIWREEQVWVKVKVLGGFGQAFRHRYMATHLGVARVDWKRKTSRMIRIVFGRALDSKKITGLEEEAKQRSSIRFHRKEYSPQDMIAHISRMSRTEFQSLSTSGHLADLSQRMFDLLTNDEPASLNRKTFLFFWQTLLEQPIQEALSLYEEIVGEERAVTLQQFTELFSIVVERLVSAKERGEGMNAALRDVHFPNGRYARLNPFYQSRYRRQILHWTCIMNNWMCMEIKDLELFRRDRDSVAETVGELFTAVEADEQGLTYPQYEILQAGLDRALYQVPLTEKEEALWFKENSTLLVSGTSVITRNTYIEFIQSELCKVISFKQDWECARALDYDIASLGIGANQVFMEMRYYKYYSRYASGTEIAYNQWVRVRRCNCVLDMFEVFHKCNVKNLYKVISTAITNTHFENPGRQVFLQIAHLALEQLHALVLEEYRLSAIAHLVFSTIQPHSPEHDYATFLLYGKQMCEAFRLPEEHLLELFNSHVSGSGQITEAGFVDCLKQVIMMFRMINTV